jgi:hypothetical protein
VPQRLLIAIAAAAGIVLTASLGPAATRAW